MRLLPLLCLLATAPLLGAAPIAADTESFEIGGAKPGPSVLIYGSLSREGIAGSVAAEEMRLWSVTSGRLTIIPAHVDGYVTGEPLPKPATTPEKTKAVEAAVAKLAAAIAPALRISLLDELPPVKKTPAADVETPPGAPAATPAPVDPVLIVEPHDAKTAAQLEPIVAKLNSERAAGSGQLELRTAKAHGTTPWFTLVSTTGSIAQRARLHRQVVHALLADQLDPATTVDTLADPKATTRIALFDAAGSAGAGIPAVLEHLRAQPSTQVVRVCPEDIAAGVLKQFTTTMFTGGSGSRQSSSLGEENRGRVRDFVNAGGGYIGICAGSYLACEGFSWGLGIINAKTPSPKWERGRAVLKMELSAPGKSVLGERAETFDCLYHNGPLLIPANDPKLPPFEPLAYFRTETAEHGSPKGIMENSPSIIRSTFGQGRVLCISPHPEQTPGLEEFIPRAVVWVNGQ